MGYTEIVNAGAGQPNEGQVIDTIVHTTIAKPLDGGEQRRAMILGRARELDKKGKHLEASALRATIGE